jgi:hypothetical protein
LRLQPEGVRGSTDERNLLQGNDLKDRTLYGAVTMRTGLMRCLLFDSGGTVVGVEEQVAKADVPAAVRTRWPPREG